MTRTTALTERQVEILQLIADGASPKQTARELGIALKTVHNHLSITYRVLDVDSITHAVVAAARLGVINLGVPA